MLHELRRGAARIGLDIKRFRPHPWRPVQLSIEIPTIIDVGAADGTPELYNAYPSSKIVAIDPIAEQLARLEAKLVDRDVDYIETALGDHEGQVELHVDHDNLLKSTANKRTELTASNGPSTARIVRMRRLDDLVAQGGWQPPYALKIDTEGHELAVLTGATETLSKCAVVYCETSVAGRFAGGYRFSQVARFMLDLGFDLVDVIDAPVGVDGRTVFLDCVWMPGVGGASGARSS